MRGNSCVVVEGQEDTEWYHSAKNDFKVVLRNQ